MKVKASRFCLSSFTMVDCEFRSSVISVQVQYISVHNTSVFRDKPSHVIVSLVCIASFIPQYLYLS